jgi:hypothetical protein
MKAWSGKLQLNRTRCTPPVNGAKIDFMRLTKESLRRIGQAGVLIVALACGAAPAEPAGTHERREQRNAQVSALDQSESAAMTASAAPRSEARAPEGSSEGGLVIPAGTVLPVRLNGTISSGKSKAGQVITGRIMQDVPLAGGAKIPAGSKVVGHIVEKVAGSAGTPGHVSLQFDKVVTAHQTIPITADLRAMAGFMRVAEAQVPLSGTGETEVYRWLTTVQIGGDVVYGEGGPVTSGENPNEIVGKKVNDGVLGHVRAKQGSKCRGELDGNSGPQALWVFSGDACGTYGMEHVHIAHAGRSEPLGLIVLASEDGDLKIASGAGLLLRVNGNERE